MTARAKTVTVMVIHPNFKTVTVTVIFRKSILESNKTAGNNFDSNSKIRRKLWFLPETNWVRFQGTNWLVPGTNMGSSQGQPDQKAYVYERRRVSGHLVLQ